jgi:hypothetical protein
MMLPNAGRAVVDQEKVTAYLLNPRHPDNGGKAPFFLSLGFRADDWLTMARALRQLAAAFPVGKTLASAHGRKYVLDGRIETPSGATPMVRTVWIVDTGQQTPRLVTAYPRQDQA